MNKSINIYMCTFFDIGYLFVSLAKGKFRHQKSILTKVSHHICYMCIIASDHTDRHGAKPTELAVESFFPTVIWNLQTTRYLRN